MRIENCIICDLESAGPFDPSLKQKVSWVTRLYNIALNAFSRRFGRD